MEKIRPYVINLITSCFSLWVVLAFLPLFSLFTHNQITEAAALFAIIFQALIMGIIFKIYRAAPRGDDKKIFLLLFLSSTALFINDLPFYIISYLNGAALSNASFLEFASYYIPFLIWFIISTIVLSKILASHILKKRLFIRTFGIILILNLLLLPLFFLLIRYDLFGTSSIVTFLNFACFFELILFDLSILCLIYAEALGIQLFLAGICTTIASAFLFNFSSVDRAGTMLVYGEIFWLLGVLLMFAGLIFIYQNKTFSFSNCFRKKNTIKSHLIVWTFGVSLLSFLLFIIVAYSFSPLNKIAFGALSFFIMAYSIVVVFASVLIGKYFETQFKKITNNIEVFMLNKDKDKITDRFSIEEFIFLQKFILNTFELNEQKDRAQKELGKLTAQVAHDIRSPLAALDMLITNLNSKVSEQERTIMRTAFRRINNIANDLVAKYKGIEQNANTHVFIYVILKDIISEKDLEYAQKNIKIELLLAQPQSAFSLIKGNYTELRRVFSNLINNAVQAMPTGGMIQVLCEKKESVISIAIIDQGQGIAEEKVGRLLSDEHAENSGIGLGLQHTKDYIKKYHGTLDIDSTIKKGTTLTLTFPVLIPPKWLAEKLIVDLSHPAVIIDDDASIHDLWSQKLAPFSLTRYDFYSPAEAKENFANKNLQQSLILCDYEFLGHAETGLDFFESIRNIPAQKYLVTTHVDNEDILKRSEEMGLQLIPKHLLPYLIIEEMARSAPASSPYFDAILIDDDPYNHEFWQFSAKQSQKKIQGFLSYEAFEAFAKNLDKNTSIYVDLNLGKVNGLDVAKKLHEQGFLNLYITSGYSNFNENDYPFLKGVISKTPPF